MAKATDFVKSNSNKKDYGRIGEGTTIGRVVNMVLLGRHTKTNYKTGEPETYDDGNPIVQSPVFITFELPNETIEIEKDGETNEMPRWISKEYAISLHEKSGLRALFSVLGLNIEKDDLDKAMTKACLINIGTTSGGKDKITGVSKLMKGMSAPELINEPKYFDPYNPDMEVWESLPQFLKDKIQEAHDYSTMKLAKILDTEVSSEDEPDNEDFDDDIPF